jgi:hypothetical protein
MNNDDRIDEFIRNAASDYNRPPATPRDEMWNAIQAARETAATGPQLRVVGGSAAAAPRGGYSVSKRSTPRYAWFGLAAAAVLLVATGVGIGRWTSPASGTAERRIADAPSLNAPVVTGDGEVAPENRGAKPSEATPAPAAEPGRQTQQPASGRSREEIRQNPIVVGRGPARLLVSESRPSVPTGNGDLQTVSYQVATQQHLQDAEALLTSFTLESRDERMNSQFAGWAKGLLSNTRLLLDSPAGDDPRRAKLLQDLELVLAQIVQLSPEAPAADRELVQGSIQNGMVMTRLRSAIPADQPREITERQ